MLNPVIVSELERIYAQPSGRLTSADVEQWIHDTGMLRIDFYDEIAMYLARGSRSASLTFDYCDAVANDVWSNMIHVGARDDPDASSEILFAVYCAFDEGEYTGKSQEPVAEYTSVILAHFLAWFEVHGEAFLKLRQDLHACCDIEARQRIQERLAEQFKAAIPSLPPH